jgi:hypothetical protein
MKCGPAKKLSGIYLIVITLAAAGIIFVPENGGGVGIRLRKSPGPIGAELTSASKLPATSGLPSRKKPR